MQIVPCFLVEPNEHQVLCSKLSTFIVKEKFFKYRSGDLDELPKINPSILEKLDKIDTLYITDEDKYFIYNISEDLVYEAFGYNSDLYTIDEIIENPSLSNSTKKDSYKIFINSSLCSIKNQDINNIAKNYLKDNK